MQPQQTLPTDNSAVQDVETFSQAVFLTIQSDPQAQEVWYQFNCSDAIRGTRPDFLKTLTQLFNAKPAGSYLVQVGITLTLQTLDFEPQKATESDEEDTSPADYASHDTQSVVLKTGQLEATETTPLPQSLGASV